MKAKSKIRRVSWFRVLIRLMLGVLLVTLLITLPFRWIPPPTSSFILQAGSGGLGSGRPCSRIQRSWVDLERMAPVIPLAVIAAEDQRFPQHSGLDLDAIAQALEERQVTGRVRGASTLSQQLVKNLYLWPGQSWLRKGLEAWLALTIEATWPKRRIMEVYLNLVQFGHCTFGVEAASRHFFAKPASRISAPEAARLAAVLPNPLRYRADRMSPFMRERERWILEQMRALGGISFLRHL